MEMVVIAARGERSPLTPFCGGGSHTHINLSLAPDHTTSPITATVVMRCVCASHRAIRSNAFERRIFELLYAMNRNKQQQPLYRSITTSSLRRQRCYRQADSSERQACQDSALECVENLPSKQIFHFRCCFGVSRKHS